MDHQKIRAAIYTRVSTKDETAEAQLQKLQQYAHQRSFTLHRDYVDYVSDGSKKRKSENKAYQELLVDASKGLINCVIVWNYDSFARSLSMLIEGLEQFNKLGVNFISYTQDIDTTTATGQLFYNVIGSLSEFDNKVSSKSVKAGLANARANGVRLGRPEKDPVAASRIAALREEGWSLRKIAQQEKLSAAGVLKVLNRNKEKTSSVAAKKTPEQKPEVAPEKTILGPSDASLVASAVPEICQLKIFLCIIEPQVWRRVLVPSDITLAKLHEVIQILFDWDGYSEHEFVPTDARGNGVTLKCDEAIFRFSDLDFKPGDRMLYEYGLLDWTHDIVFEKNVPFDKDDQYPICTDGRMTSPPEDCGGAMAFMDKLSLMKGRKVKGSRKGRIFGFDQDFCREIVQRGGLDAFDKEAVNKRLAALASTMTRNNGKNEGKATLVLVSSEKQTTVTVHIYIERNSKFVRGMKNARENIEQFCLSFYKPMKLRDGQYELTFTYKDSADLDKQAYDLIQEIHDEADLRNCFAEVSLSENGTDRRWS